MGGGASSGSIEGLLQTTMMVGRAIASIYRNPGMYRISDFHSELAPRLKSTMAMQRQQFVFFGQEDSDDDEEDEDDYDDPPEEQYEHLFHIVCQDEHIYIDDILLENEDGWTALHTCCMSFLSAPAGLSIIDEVKRKNGSLDGKTRAGPGTFNRGWTPLHMASAYNVEPIVEKLLTNGADPNTMNSFGYAPLLEACHRGYLPIVSALVKAGASLSHIPPDELSARSPFAAAPAHTALGEASRCGYIKIVDFLLDQGAGKDDVNSLGWTPLHEACFYNRIEVVKALMVSGASCTIRTRSNALPYHLSGLEEIRKMIEEMGGPDALPAQEGDDINILDILHEITLGVPKDNSQQIEDGHDEDGTISFQLGADGGGFGVGYGDGEVEIVDMMEQLRDEMDREIMEDELENESKNAETKEDRQDAKVVPTVTPEKISNRDIREYEADDTTSEPALLHSGKILGDLPSLNNVKSPPGAHQANDKVLHEALQYGNASIMGGTKGASPTSKKADSKGKKKKNKKKRDDLPADIPPNYLCQLSQRPMSDPVKSVYGNIFERQTILQWFSQQGQICPLTGAPLTENDLKPMEELGQEIIQWMLKKSTETTTNTEEPSGVPGGAAKADDDLYDF